MSTNLRTHGIHHVNEWRAFDGFCHRQSDSTGRRWLSIRRGVVMMLIIPTVLLLIYLAAPVVMSYINPTVSYPTETPHSLQLDPTCSPFGTLSTCVQVAVPFEEPPA